MNKQIDKYLQIILDTPELFNVLKINIKIIYGITLSGSRIFNLESNYDDCISDYDLNIIVDTDSYNKIKDIPEKYLPEIVFGHKARVHGYFTPIDFNQYHFEGGFGLEGGLAVMLKKLTIDNFIYVADSEKLNTFISQVNNRINEAKDFFKIKYKNNTQLLQQNIEQFLHKKSYLLVYISNLLNNQQPNTAKLLMFKQLTRQYGPAQAHNAIKLPKELKKYIYNSYKELLIGLWNQQ